MRARARAPNATASRRRRAVRSRRAWTRLAARNSRSSPASPRPPCCSHSLRFEQVRAAIEPVLVAVVRQPVRGRRAQAAMDADALAALLDPRTQARPLAQQRLVRDLHGSLAEGQQAPVGEHLDDPADVFAALDLELVQRDAPALDRAGVASVTSAISTRRAVSLLVGVERAERILTESRHEPRTPPVRSYAALVSRRPSRCCHSSRSAADRSGSAPGSASTSSSSAEGERRFDPQAGAFRGAFDRAQELVAAA